MKRIRTVQIGMDWFPYQAGGLNRYFYDLVHALPGVEICGSAYVSYVRDDAVAPLALEAIAPQRASFLRQMLGSRSAARRALAKPPDILHSHFAKFAYSWMSEIPPDMPFIVNFHGPWADEIAVEKPGMSGRFRYALARHIEKRVYNRGNVFITLSQAFKQTLHDRYGVPLDRIRILPPGINLSRFNSAPERSEARRLLGWSAERPILITVRRIVRRMGLELLLDAMSIVKKTSPNCLLLIAGKGSQEAEIDRHIEQAGLQNNVRRIGFVPDSQLPTAYAAADMAIVPSLSLEGFGLATVESLASGTPVLATNVGGTPEILRQLQPDLLFPEISPESIAERISSALAHRSSVPDRAMCREFASQYSWPVIAQQVRAIYDDMLGFTSGAR